MVHWHATLAALALADAEDEGLGALALGRFRYCSSLLATDAAPRSKAAWKAELSAGFLRSKVAPADDMVCTVFGLGWARARGSKFLRTKFLFLAQVPVLSSTNA